MTPDIPTYPVLEQSSGIFDAILVGEDGVTPVPGTTLTTLTLTLYVTKRDGTDTIINSRNQQDVLNTNDVTIDSAGNLQWHIRVADTTLVEDVRNERHVALWEWTWPTGRAGKFEMALIIRNLRRVS